MKKDRKIFSVQLTYNIEALDAVQAIDDVIGKHPLKPIGVSCEPIVEEEDDYDD